VVASISGGRFNTAHGESASISGVRIPVDRDHRFRSIVIAQSS
jgi:hypothetical protein